MRKITSALAMTLLCAVAAHACLAEAPSSQFFFTGWPYRQSTPCMGADTTQQPAACTAAQPGATPAQPDATQEPPAATPRPTAVITAAPAATSTPMVTSPGAAVTKPSTTQDYTTSSVQMQEQKAWNLLNQDRAANGLAALPLDAELSRLARLKSEDMRSNHYFAHESPTFGRAKDMLTSFGYSFASVGENIAHHSTVDKAQAAFLSSTDHRRNMMSTAWTKVGIGIAYDEQGFVYVTQLFVR